MAIVGPRKPGKIPSGRIVIEVLPEQKEEMYEALHLARKTMKDWYLEASADFLDRQKQPVLFEPVPAKPELKPKKIGKK